MIASLPSRRLDYAARLVAAAVVTLAAIASTGRPALAEPPTGSPEIRRTVDVRNLSVEGDTVKGVLVNRSSNTLRQVQLLVKKTWFWKDERNPGPESPGASEYITVEATIPPGGEAPFSTRLPSGSAPTAPGHFEVSAEPVGYTEVIQPR
jgi:hypothetical protein